jgi:hypothetical protein
VRAAAVVLSYGRRELGELLTMWARQSRGVPLLVWFDDCATDCAALAGGGVVFHRGPRAGGRTTIGGVRRAAVEYARQLFALEPDDAILTLDDDDFYSSHHAAVSLAALEQGAEWTGARRIGIQWRPYQLPPELVASDGGPGQHATWAMLLSTYDRAGGYREQDRVEDMALAERLGWSACQPHRCLTHVRRQFGGASSLSAPGVAYDRDALRAAGELPTWIAPSWSHELTELERWALEHEI